MFRLTWYLKDHYRLHKDPLPVPKLNQVNSVYTVLLFKICLINIILPSAPVSRLVSLLQIFPTKILLAILILPSPATSLRSILLDKVQITVP